MGGSGSTRWAGQRKKKTVQTCLALSIGELRRAGVDMRRLPFEGVVGWHTWAGVERASLGFSIHDRDGEPELTLRYQFSTSTQIFSARRAVCAHAGPVGAAGAPVAEAR